MKLYREAQKDLEMYRTESDATSRSFYAMGAEHYRKQLEEEQKGYDRGLADGRAEASPIASEPKDAGSGEGQEMTRDEQERAITFLRTMGYLDGDRSSNQWLAAFHTAGYRIAPSGAKS